MAMHILSVSWIAVALLLCSLQASCARTTEEEIRDAMITLVHKIRSTEGKLERHEYREKALGELLKAKLTGLDKQHKALEPLVGLITRLDERLSNVETVLLRDKDHEVIAQKKTNEALERIQKSLELLSKTVADNIKETKNAREIDNNLTLNEDSPLERRLDITDAKIDTVKLEIENLKHTLKKDTLRAVCKEMAYDVNPLEKHITEAEKLLNKFDIKLNKYNESAYNTNVIPLNTVSPADDAWKSKMTEVMVRQEEDVKKIHKQLSDAESVWKELPKRIDLQTATNETLRAVANITETVKESAANSVNKLETKLREMGDRLVTTNEDIQHSLTDGNTLTERAFNDMAKSYEALRTDIQTLRKSEEGIQQIRDKIIETKHRINYGVKEILDGVTLLIQMQARSMNRTVNERFNSIETTLVGSQTNALSNLTTRVELKLSEVWSQIGIMHQQLLLTKASLENLTDETQQYANSSTKTMGKMKEEVTDISKNVVELKENLNYAVGKLGLVTQEFDRITTGVADALTSLKADITKSTVTTEDPGPGPHNITSAIAEKKP